MSNNVNLKMRLKNKHDIPANWANATFAPMAGEIVVYDDHYFDDDGNKVVVADAVKFKIGDGVTPINDLPFVSDTAELEKLIEETYETKADAEEAYDNFATLLSNINIENGLGEYSLEQKGIGPKAPIASGYGAVAFGGFRGDKPDEVPTEEDKTNVADGIQSAVFGCGNLAAGDWSFVTGKDNIVYSNRSFVSGGANLTGEVDADGNQTFEATNVGRFNAIFGNNNTFTSTDVSREANLIAGGSNIVDTERSIVVGYNNNVKGSFDAVFGQGNVAVDTTRSIIGGFKNTVNGGSHLVSGESNTVGGVDNLTTGTNNINEGWHSATIGKNLTIGKGNTAQTVIGQYNENKADTVFEIGWGEEGAAKNIFEVYKDGSLSTRTGKVITETSLQGTTKLKVGIANTDTYANNSLTIGNGSKNRGDQSIAAGYEACVGYNKDGSETYEKPTGAAAFGWSRANAQYTLSAGYDTEASNDYSVALNNKTKTGAVAQTVVGAYNVGKDDTYFEVGNGDSSTRKNAFEVYRGGNATVQKTTDNNTDVVNVAYLKNYTSNLEKLIDGLTEEQIIALNNFAKSLVVTVEE